MSQAEFNWLKRRIDELEGGQSLGRGSLPTVSAERGPSTPFSPREAEEGEGEGEGDGDGDGGTDSANESMTMMGLIEDEHQSPSRLYGDSSAKTFVNRIKSVLDLQSTLAQPNSSRSKRAHVRSPAARRVSTKQQRPFQDYLLPSRQRADHLLASYWRLVVYPFLDREEVETLYRRLWTGEDLGEDGPAFLCLINVIFGMVCLMNPETIPSERSKNADVFYRRAREFVDLKFLEIRSLLAVQCFLLLGEYLQSKNDPQGCWMFIGLAVRSAQSLGLDLASTSLEAPSVHGRENLRRVWHGCVLMDRSLAMTHGRPAMITSQAAAAVPYPSAHLDPHTCNCFDGSESVTDTSPDTINQASCHFFIEALKLYEVMNEIWLTLYNPAATPAELPHDVFSVYFGSLGGKAVGIIMGMDTKLWSLTHDLPIYLRYSPSAVKATIQQRQSNILWLRHRHIRLLLFRPVLARFCNPYEATQPTGEAEEKRLPWKIALQCSVSCVETALETINFLDRTISGRELGQLDLLLPGWWYSILYVYSAAAVLIAARLHIAVVAEVTEKAIVDGWHSVMETLRRFSSLSKYAARCAATLNVLFEQVLQRHLEGEQQQQQHQTAKVNQVQHQISRSSWPVLQQDQSQYQYRHQQEPPPTNMQHIGELDHGFISTTTTGAHTDVSGGQDWPFNSNDAYFTIAESAASATDYSPAVHLFDPADIQVDLEGMSWLTSLPSQLYGSSPV